MAFKLLENFLGPDIRKMEFGRNKKRPCGKRAKWSLGEMGKLGEMPSGRNEKWAKMKLGETVKGQDRYWAKWDWAINRTYMVVFV